MKHRDYLRCARAVIEAEAEAGDLPERCVPAVKRTVRHSTCGWRPVRNAQPCVRTAVEGGEVTCRIRATTEQDGVTPTGFCSDGGGYERVSCAAATTCVDA